MSDITPFPVIFHRDLGFFGAILQASARRVMSARGCLLLHACERHDTLSDSRARRLGRLGFVVAAVGRQLASQLVRSSVRCLRVLAAAVSERVTMHSTLRCLRRAGPSACAGEWCGCFNCEFFDSLGSGPASTSCT